MKKKYIYSFIIPIIVVLISFLILGIYPFGDKSIIVIDSNTQYVSFISYLKTILLGSNNFKYTLSSTMGQNFIPLLGYYLMSPFNIFSIFFNPSNMKLFMTIIILIKIGLCGLTMEFYLSKTYQKTNILFSICYALMSYNIIYMYHLMWLDSIILFPLVIYGIDKIFRKESPLIYILSLGFSIIFNYYIGFMICIASVIYFIYKYLYNRKVIEKFKVFVEYSISSLLGGLLSMFILLPSLFGLQGGKASFSLSNLSFAFNTSIFKVIAKMFTSSTGVGETWHGGPMIACSMLVFILLILYFLNKKVIKKDKIFDGILILVFILSFIIKDFDILFHGLNTPNCFDFRHAFILVFFLITISVKSYLKLDKNDYKKSLLIIFIVSFIIYLCKFKFNTSTYNISLIISLILSLFYIFSLSKNKKYLFLILVIDLLINTTSLILTNIISDKQYNSVYKTYITEVQEAVDSIDDDSFYRIEKTFDRETNTNFLALNDSMIFNYNGISHFDSTSHENIEILMEKLGMRRLLSRAYYNKNGSTYFVDSLLGIKYVLSYDDYKNYTLLNTVNDINIYENPYYLKTAYLIDNSDINLTMNPFENQNIIASKFTSLEDKIYTEADYSHINNEYVINVTSDNELYFYASLPDSLDASYGNAKMYVNDVLVGDYFTKYSSGTISLGKYSVSDIVKIRFEFGREIEYVPYIYYEDKEVLEKHVNILKDEDLEIIKKSSSNIIIKGNFTKDSKLFITIPYDEGFKVLIDNKEVKVEDCISLMSIDVSMGNHVIELSYEPKGLKLGIYISLLSILLTIVFVLLKDKLWSLYLKYKEICNYLVVGALTTLVSLLSYFILSRILDINNNFNFILSNTISWILSVIFAYITNKIYVFETKNSNILKEFTKFISSRIITYLIDLLLMFIFVKVIFINNDISKLLVQVIILVLNYIFSKLIVFKK